MAREIGVSSQLYGYYESGAKVPGGEFFMLWKKKFGHDLTENIETIVSHESTANQSNPNVQLIENNRILSTAYQTLAEANRMLAEANLLLAKTINSNRSGKVLVPDYSGEKGTRQDVQIDKTLDKIKAIRPVKAIQSVKGTSRPAGS